MRSVTQEKQNLVIIAIAVVTYSTKLSCPRDEYYFYTFLSNNSFEHELGYMTEGSTVCRRTPATI